MKKKTARKPANAQPAAILTPLVATAAEMEMLKIKLERARKKILSGEKALETMRAGRKQLLARYAELQRQLNDAAMAKAE